MTALIESLLKNVGIWRSFILTPILHRKMNNFKLALLCAIIWLIAYTLGEILTNSISLNLDYKYMFLKIACFLTIFCLSFGLMYVFEKYNKGE